MRPPFTLLAGNRQSRSPNSVVRSKRAQDDNKEGASSSLATPSMNLQSVNHTRSTASPARRCAASPSVFTRSPLPHVQEDAFSSTAYILDDMMDIDDISSDNLLSAPAQVVNDLMSTNNNNNNSHIFAQETRVRTPKSSRKVLQVKTTTEGVEIRIVQQDTPRPEHVPLPASSPMKQHSPIKRIIKSTVEEDDNDEGMEVREAANVFEEEELLTEQAAAIPLPPSPEKPGTGYYQDTTMLKSPSMHRAREDSATPASNDADMADATHVQSLPSISSPHKDAQVEAAIQAEAFLSPTQVHTRAVPHFSSGADTCQEGEGDTTFDLARGVELPLSPQKPSVQDVADAEKEEEALPADDDIIEDTAESSTSTKSDFLMKKYKQRVEKMLDQFQDDDDSSDSDSDEDEEDKMIKREVKAAERQVYNATLDVIMHDSDSDGDSDSEEDEIDVEMKETIFETLQKARENIAQPGSTSPPLQTQRDLPEISEEDNNGGNENEDEELESVREVCHYAISEFGKTHFKKTEDRERFQHEMTQLLAEEERVIREEEQEEYETVRGLKSPVVEHVKAFPLASDDIPRSIPSMHSRPAASTASEHKENMNQEEYTILQLAINTQLPPSPEKKTSQADGQEDQQVLRETAQQDMETTVLGQAEECSPVEALSHTRLSIPEDANSPSHLLLAVSPPTNTTRTSLPQAAEMSTPSTSRHASTSHQATPPPARNQESSHEIHLKAPTALRQLSTSSKPTAIRGRGRPKGAIKKKDQVNDKLAGPAVLGEVQIEVEGATLEEKEKPARRSTRSKATLSRNATKDSLVSIASTSASHTTITSKRGAGAGKRKRSASVASQAEKENSSQIEQGVKNEDTTMQLDEQSVRTGTEAVDEALRSGEEVITSEAAPTTVNRASRRTTAVSALPQPKSKLKIRKIATASSSSSSYALPSASDETGNKRRKTNSVQTSTSSDELVASASCASATPREHVVPVKRAIPHRSTRTATISAARVQATATSAQANVNAKVASSIIRSPSRVVGSPKRSNTLGGQSQMKEAQQAKKTTIPLFAQPNIHRNKDDHAPSPGPRTAPRSPSRVFQAQNAATSPTKAVASSSSMNVSTTMRSPLRIPGAGGNFDWPKSTSSSQRTDVGTSKPVTGYSEETWMRARSKVFGTNIPAKHAGGPAASAVNALSSSTNGFKPAASSSSFSSTTPAIVSPIKTAVSQRMLAPPSPGLLNLSVTPESLLLVSAGPTLSPAAEPAAAPSTSFLTTSAAPPNVAAASSVFSSQRGASQPPQGPSQSMTQGPAGLASPRRALSAQPPASPRRVDLPSPRRVLASSSNTSRPVPSPARIAAVFAAPAGKSSSSSIPTASRLPALKQSAQHAEAVQAPPQDVNPAPVVTPKNPSIAIATGRRSARTTRQREKFPDVVAATTSKEKPTNTIRAVQARALPPAKNASVMTAAQLAALTMKNTSNNKAHYNLHKVTTIYKDEDRPPSPTSKIRKIMEASDVTVSYAVGTSSQAPGAGSKRKAEEAGLTVDKGKGKKVENTPITTASGRKPHFRAAGDEDIFESPVKVRKVSHEDRLEQASRAVKWDRDLLKEVQDVRTPRRARSKASEALSRRAFKITRGLDGNGNVPDCKASLSPIVPRQQVPISKIIYRDDADE